jgi:hypothetical protein
MIHEDYDFWRKALSGEKPPIHDGEVHFGYFKTKRGQGKGGEFVPVAFWRDEDVVCLRGNRKISADEFADEFSWACKHPISHEDSSSWYRNGGAWQQETAQAGIGHNSGELTPLEQINTDIEALQERMKNAINENALADCKTIATKIETRIEDMRKAEKEPHLTASREVDAKFKVIIAPVLSIKADSATKLTVILKQRRDEENARIAKERAEREEAARLEALSNPQAAPVVIEEPKARKVQAGGNHGNKTSLRTTKECEITDINAVLEFFKGNSAFLEAIEPVLKRMALALLIVDVPVNGAKLNIIYKV